MTKKIKERDLMARRMIWECVALCGKHCTVRTYGEKPQKCLYWHNCECWIRKDKHKPEVEDYANGND